jgi:DNA-binding transcriptional MerR regulator
MGLIDVDKPIIPLSGVAQMLNAKLRTLRMYEEKGLLPVCEGSKKLYSINDLRIIAFVHYLASFKKVNANGVRFVLELLNEHMDRDQKEALLASVEEVIEKLSPKEIEGEFEDF